MNQIFFSSFHICAMGCAGYVFGKALQVDSKLFAITGLVSSILFQLLAEDMELRLLIDQSNRMQYPIPEMFERNREFYRNIANILVSAMCVSVSFGKMYDPSNRNVQLAKAIFMGCSFISASYFFAKTGTDCFLGDKDFSVLTHSRERVW